MEEAVMELDGLETVEQGQEQQQTQETTQTEARAQEKSYRDFVKGLREDGDAGTHYKRIKNDYGRLQELGRIDPKGIDGVRATYESLKGLAHGDKQGLEAAREMQAALSESQAVLDALADGNVDVLSEDQQAGVLRMIPSVLDRLAETDAEGYTKAMLPHFMDALKASEMVGAFDSMVSILKQQPPSYLTKEQIGAWQAEKFESVVQEATKMAQWFQAQERRLQQMGTDSKSGRTMERGGERQQPSANEPAAGQQWWSQNVHTEVNQHAEDTFSKELRPWADKLAKSGFRLSDAKKAALAQEFVGGVTRAAMANPAYASQIKRYNMQKSPDASAIKALAKTEFNRHAARVMKDLVNRDYGQVLDGKRVTQKPGTNGKPAAAPQKGVRVVTVMPERRNIDFPRTPEEWLYKDQYRLRDGSVVQYRP